MIVCEKCHIADQTVTGCEVRFEDHLVEVTGRCDICNRKGALMWCSKYTSKIKRSPTTLPALIRESRSC